MIMKIWDFILLLIVVIDSTYADTFKECEGKDQTYVDFKEDCSFYIFCHGEESFSDSCPDDSPYFSIEEQTCDTNRNVCKDRAIIKEVATTEDEEVSTEPTTPERTSSSSSFTITIPTAESSNNLASSTTSFMSSTVFDSAGNQSVTTVSPSPLIPTSCPAVDNPKRLIFLPHAKSCSEYYLCFQGQRLPLRCSNMLHFDVRQQKCDYPENVKCHMMDIASPREQCLPRTFDLYPHPRNCNYYYQCILGYLKVMQCPLNMGWHYEKRACVRLSQAKCYNSSARGILK